ncbi:Pre-mRNA-splicing factor SLU7 [Neolecta irregularis DAH-3]|uniref:Pre-mRNA-splicing factor SLU7 n=1 Tax=Neolecta irregularis (strain DAH-3) TaxID=1198029 RepID=A0A1U7LHF1_NEOID|nr:Pre-mRNA-splicing factor SLU7 [Neolecta irregularis DAH-3]|eukprot:OLL22086.1 Pre-mRNA-splicing factor SLU7 [Neolecta irregularis DAH-3]
MDRPDFSSSNMMPMGGGVPVKQTREQRRQIKELEEARKAGKAPAEKDEEGNAINPHIPQFISRAPWYVDETGGASLKHQRVRHDNDGEDDKNKWYQRGIRAGPAATKYRKGACENCGANTHKAKDCLGRPRKLGAKWSGKDIQPDEVIQNVDLTWNAKRDRWNGYDPSEHKTIVEEYERMEELRKQLEEKGEAEQETEEKFAEVSEALGQAYDPSSRIMTRNLRMREDTARYLMASDNANYDPKTRTMHGDVKTVNQGTPEEGFVRGSTGEAADFDKLQKFAWQAEERGASFNIQANPTEGALLHKKYLEEKDRQKSKVKGGILEKYGGEQFLVAPPKELTQSEAYVEYSASGTIIKGEKTKAKSRWKEDGIHLN